MSIQSNKIAGLNLSAKNTFWILLSLIFLLMLFLVPQYGITGDAVTQWRYGDFVWSYMKTFGADKRVLTDPFIEQHGLKDYGGFFDGFAAMLIDIFNPKDEFLLRHYWNMVFGFCGILFAGLIAKELSGWRAATITILVLVLTPRFFGPLFNNPKDVPFATSYLISLYCIIKWLQKLEKPSWKTTILLGLSIALAISIRIGGVLVIAYLGLFFLIEAARTNLFKTKSFGTSVLHMAVAVLLGWLGGVLWWPYALEDVVNHPIEALMLMSDYPLNIATLYKGEKIRTTAIPADYLPTWISIGTPIFILAGFLGSFACLIKWVKKPTKTFYFLLFFATIFPVFYIIYKKSVVYDGMRHIIFVLPLISLLAALCFDYLLETLKNKKALQLTVLGGIVVLAALPLRFMVANHPNQDVYFNEFVGGIKGAYGNYETDYYWNSIKEGLDWLVENRLKKEYNPNGDSIIVASNAPALFDIYQKMSLVPFKFVYVRYYQRNEHDWDYGIFMSRFLDKEQLINGYFPGDKPIYMVTADHVPLTTVLANDPDRNGYKGMQALRERNDEQAISYLSKAAQLYPTDAEAWRNLAIAQIQTGDAANAEVSIKKAYAISSLDIANASVAGQILLRLNKYQEAANVFGKMTNDYPDMAEGWLGFGQAQTGLGNFDAAITNINKAMVVNPAITLEAYNTLAYIYQQKGDFETAQKYINAVQQAR